MSAARNGSTAGCSTSGSYWISEENVTFSGGFAIQEKFAWLTGLAEDSVRSRPNNMELYFETDDLDAFMQRLGEWPDPSNCSTRPKYGWQQCTVRFPFTIPTATIVEVGEAMEVVIRRCLAEGHTAEETAALTQHPLEFVLRVGTKRGNSPAHPGKQPRTRPAPAARYAGAAQKTALRPTLGLSQKDTGQMPGVLFMSGAEPGRRATSARGTFPEEGRRAPCGAIPKVVPCRRNP